MGFVERYQRVTGYRGADRDPADPAQALAMPLILRIEKNEPPNRADLLAAAARASVLLCLDERSDPNAPGPWSAAVDAWCAGRIRKIARRARGAHWVAAGDVNGITATSGSAQARALVPGPVGVLDKRIARLQIGGTDVAGELPDGAGGPGGGVVLYINPDVPMTTGKLAAQVGHASMLMLTLMTVGEAREWYECGCPCVVACPDTRRWAWLLAASRSGKAVAVHDAGFTEIAPGSVTVIAARE